jgi:decaprenylphospho-beta-D-ribofuranose 2-oxidase
VPQPARARFWGWGRTNPTVAEELTVSARDAASLLKEVGPRGALARGLGRSYGDAAQNGGGAVLRLRSTTGDIILDTAAGTATVGGGVSLDELLRVIVPRGFFVPVTPGTRFVTIGGAIACDIHGKNHHVDGSLGNHVESITMTLADGDTVTVTPNDNPALFWATVGGMGLTGLIVAATIRLLPIETSRMRVDTTRLESLDELFAAMSEGDDAVRYSVAWIDLLATRGHLGRSVLNRADHASVADLGNRAAVAPLAFRPRQLLSIPPIVPGRGVLTHSTVAAFNEFWFRHAPRRRLAEIQDLAAFFHPLDMVGSWNRLYGKRGMVQYQFVVPFGQEETMRAVIERLARFGAASFLAVLKRFGPGNAGPLSFAQSGWTLALDLAIPSAGLGELLHGLDDVVLGAGGRHYLAKDGHTTPEAVRRGYPRLDEWRQVRAAVDPNGLWQSDLGRRLGLI